MFKNNYFSIQVVPSLEDANVKVYGVVNNATNVIEYRTRRYSEAIVTAEVEAHILEKNYHNEEVAQQIAQMDEHYRRADRPSVVPFSKPN